MSDAPINLNKVRKARDKADAQARAKGNRIAFGRTKAEKQADALRQAKATKVLDGAKREP